MTHMSAYEIEMRTRAARSAFVAHLLRRVFVGLSWRR